MGGFWLLPVCRREDRPGLRRVWRCVIAGMGQRCLLVPRGGFDGQGEGKPAPCHNRAIVEVLRLDPAPVALHDRPAQRQADAHAFGLGGEEGLVQPGDHFLGQAGALVGDGELDHAALRRACGAGSPAARCGGAPAASWRCRWPRRRSSAGSAAPARSGSGRTADRRAGAGPRSGGWPRCGGAARCWPVPPPPRRWPWPASRLALRLALLHEGADAVDDLAGALGLARGLAQRGDQRVRSMVSALTRLTMPLQ